MEHVDQAALEQFSDHADTARAEINATITELIDLYGPRPVVESVTQGELSTYLVSSNDKTAQILRAYSVLIIEADRPKLVAELVGRLVGLDLGAGKQRRLEDIGRDAGLTKQAVSKKLGELAESLNLPRPHSSEHARKSHRLMNRRNYRK